MLLGTIGARADYNVTVGTIFTYDVVASTWTVADGTNTGTGSGFTFEGSQFPVGTQVEVEVLTASGSNIGFNETIGSVYDESSATPACNYTCRRLVYKPCPGPDSRGLSPIPDRYLPSACWCILAR